VKVDELVLEVVARESSTGFTIVRLESDRWAIGWRSIVGEKAGLVLLQPSREDAEKAFWYLTIEI